MRPDALDSDRRRRNMREVAEHANVAISSVSRVLSNHPDVSRDMRERVMAAVRELEYEPDFLAQSLRRGATLTIGFLISDITNPLMADIVSGAESYLRARGYSMLVMSSGHDPTLDASDIRFLKGRRVDGMILSLGSERATDTLEQLQGLGRPAVVVDREVPADVGVSAVLSDHHAGMVDAVRHLLDLGHRRLALIAGPEDVRPGYARVLAVRAAMSERALGDDAVAISGPFSPHHGAEATLALLDREQPPTAIIAGSNLLLVGVLRALRSRGLAVGEDVSLVTCDDIPLAAFYSPPLSVVARDTVALGRTAADLLLRRLGDEDPGPETVTLPTTFIPRGSTVPPSPEAGA